MQYSAILLALATGSLAASYEYLPKNGTAYETVTLTAITTYCPYPTEVVHNSKTYTVTEATTLTITDCPCTITKPIVHPVASTVLYTSCPPEASSKSQAPHPEPPKSTGPAYSNPLTVVYPSVTEKKPVGTASYTPTQATYPTQFTGAAHANKVGSLMVGAAALAAFAL